MTGARRDRSIVIVGGGIGGLTAAVALRRTGARVHVCERSAELAAAQAGHGLVLWHNAVLALRAAGLGALPAAIGHELRHHQFWSYRGGRLSNWPVGEHGDRLGAPAYTVSRPALHEALCHEVGDDLELGARCVGYEEDDGGVVVRFDDGRELRADLLIGADGLRSAVRAQMRPYEPPPRYAGFTAWQGVSEVVPDGVPPHTFRGVWGRGRWFVYYRLPDGRVYWDGVIGDRVLRDMDSVGEDGRTILTRQFGDWPDPVPALIEATTSDRFTPVDIFDRDPVPVWSTRRATLVGDAAHPMTFNLGQGANQAIEGAVVLASSLVTESDIDDALRAYEAHRVDRISRMVRRSRGNGEMTRWHGALTCRFRDLVLRAILDRIVLTKTYDLTVDPQLHDLPVPDPLEQLA
ncbi:MAG: FAD-dependent monooxygenase [Acidimicrobiales bacterium]